MCGAFQCGHPRLEVYQALIGFRFAEARPRKQHSVNQRTDGNGDSHAEYDDLVMSLRCPQAHDNAVSSEHQGHQRYRPDFNTCDADHVRHACVSQAGLCEGKQPCKSQQAHASYEGYLVPGGLRAVTD
jgi:hypothetical protein